MRLLEPLNGIKVGQGHYIIHLYFFISMVLIDPDRSFHRKLVDHSNVNKEFERIYDKEWHMGTNFDKFYE